jgi:hypothetical protein
MKEMKENQRRQTHHVSSVPSFCSRATCGRASKQERNWTKAFPHISFFYDFSSFPKSSWTSFIHNIVQQPSLVSGPIHLQLGSHSRIGSDVANETQHQKLFTYIPRLSLKSKSPTWFSITFPRFQQPSWCRIGANTNTPDSFSLESTETTRLGLKTHCLSKQFAQVLDAITTAFQNGKVKSIN